MEIQSNILLSQYASLRVGGPAEFFAAVQSDVDIVEALEFAATNEIPVTVLGSGSNVLIADRGIKGLVLHIENKGLEIVAENEQRVIVRIAAGEDWDTAVAWSAEHEFWGMENMSAIPSTVGASAVGNIGAYGQNVSQVITSVDAVDIETQEHVQFSNEECGFGYRTSIFNSIERGRYVISHVSFVLSKVAAPSLEYADLKAYFAEHHTANVVGLGEATPSISEIRSAIVAIRSAKLPDPKLIGNAGSFFKNPMADGQKLSAAKLIEECGLKGMALGAAQVSPQHALIITNTGEATATELFSLALLVRREVYAKTGVLLDPEPSFLGFEEDELEYFYKV